ncbi:hypothetical protein [Campylobacter ureolyticus]|uniref:Cold shock domain-containing protein n=1 Tax=Campylobacter ureolyticus TaxID=827 RepID=A0A9Q4KMC3_9BACT|nr:hypothetical protein [Campylobacter ureolyticus]MCZ6160622.1 hypothetical protein [Campylobacter ureolyticus]
MNGVIKTYLDSGGFISGTDENNYYFSKKDFSDEFQVGDFVKFEPGLGKKGYYAKEVKLKASFMYKTSNEIVIFIDKDEIDDYKMVDVLNFIKLGEEKSDFMKLQDRRFTKGLNFKKEKR